MVRFAVGALAGIVITWVAGAALGSHAAQTSESDDLATLAEQAGVDPVALEGAVNSTGLTPRGYLEMTGELLPRVPAAPAWPIGGALGQRIYCIEGIESAHGRAMWNPTPVWNGEHAQGFLGFLPSTARRWGAIIGNRASEWAAAAAMLQAGQGRQFAGVAMGRC